MMDEDIFTESAEKAKALLCDKCLALVDAQGLTIPVRELCDKCSDRLLRWALHMDGFEFNEKTD
jgi:hypothetical protein